MSTRVRGDELRGADENGTVIHAFPWNLRGCFLTDSAALGEGWKSDADIVAAEAPFVPTLKDEFFWNPQAVSSKTVGSSSKTLEGGAHPTEKDISSGLKSAKSERAQPDIKGLLKVGSIIDKYRVEKLLGTGAFAAVYLVNHMLLNVPFALKLMLPHVTKTNPGFAEMLCEEASFTAKINHPNVVRVFDVTNTGPLAYIVMEYVDGMTLSAMLQRHRLSPRKVLRVGMDVCLGLQAGLDKGLIHRDIKPANLLVSSSGDTKIADLGLARLATPTGQTPSSTMDKKSGSQGFSCAGTPAYMAPEQISNPEHADFRSDIYSLGVTLFHASTGRLPFTNPVFMDLVQQHLEETPPNVQSLIPDYPPKLNDLLQRMMAKRPEQRFVSYAELHQEMKENFDVLAMIEPDSERRKSTTIIRALKQWFG